MRRLLKVLRWVALVVAVAYVTSRLKARRRMGSPNAPSRPVVSSFGPVAPDATPHPVVPADAASGDPTAGARVDVTSEGTVPAGPAAAPRDEVGETVAAEVTKATRATKAAAPPRAAKATTAKAGAAKASNAAKASKASKSTNVSKASNASRAPSRSKAAKAGSPATRARWWRAGTRPEGVDPREAGSHE